MKIPKKDENLLPVKVILLGEQDSHKIDIIRRYGSNRFMPDSEYNTIPSSFVKETEFFEKENKSIEFHIWDSISNRKYQSSTRTFIKEAKVFILVYNITKKESFDALKTYWIKEIKETCGEDVSK